LPLAQLTNFQNILLNDIIGSWATWYINGDLIANGLNRDTHTFPESNAKVDAIASIIDYQAGGDIQHDLIQYLNEREANENEWLQNLKQSTVPATLIWGVDDPIAPIAVADYVWNSSLKIRETPAWYWQLPNANHYLQNDQPVVISILIRLALGEPVDFSSISKENHPIEITN
jgi:pimeloyl-ACP methyl ester carboxylesterase